MPIGRLGVIGDIHAEHVRLKRAIGVLEERGVHLTVATGDIADGVGSVDACCELLEAHRIVTVRGNHDRWLLSGAVRDFPGATQLSAISESARAFFERLPPLVELETATGLALLCHGLGPNDMAKVGPDDFGYALETNDELQSLIRNRYFRWVINGHSHRQMVRAFPGVSVINAGTLRADHEPCFLEVDFIGESVTVFEFAADGASLLPANRVPLV